MPQQKNQNYGSLITRLSLGTILIAHGSLKLFVFTLPGTVAYFESQGFPGFTAYLVTYGELAAGTAILLGIYTRLAALLTLPILLGATFVHAGNGWVFSNQGGGWEFPVLLIALTVSVALQGSGSFAIKKLPIVDAFIPATLKA